MIALSIGLLATVLALSLAALYSAAYRDNWGQHIGLVLLALWTAAEGVAVVQDYAVAPRDLALYLGLAAFAAGTARKVLHHHPPQVDSGASTRPNDLAHSRNRAGPST